MLKVKSDVRSCVCHFFCVILQRKIIIQENYAGN